jgi:hypothetical protein
VLEKLFPAIVVAICLVLLLRLLLGERRRHRFDRTIARWSRPGADRGSLHLECQPASRPARRRGDDPPRPRAANGTANYRPSPSTKGKDRKIH